MTSCPACGKPVDPLRAPAVGVRDGKVVPFCSKECAALESGPTKLIPTKIVRLPSEDERRITGQQAATMPSADSVSPSGRHRAPDSSPPANRRAADSVAPSTRARAASPSVEAEKPPAESSKKKRAESVLIADTGHLDDFVSTDPPRRKSLVFAVLLLVVAGGAAAAYFLGYFGREPQRVVTAPPPSDAAVIVDAVPAITREVALAKAQAVLRGALEAPPRVQHMAAAALARTGDEKAREILAAAIPTGDSDIAKIKLAYALGRAGDKRGSDALVAAAVPSKREAKHEAGSRLAWLGDPRAVKVLESSLAFPQFKLGVAEQLAYLKHVKALEILDATRADPKALPDDKARATIALGWAGRTDVAPALREMLADDRNNAHAAAALASLHDEAARPVLERQLELTSLRVEAARGLRQLAPDADVAPLLAKLVPELDSKKDTEQVDIAEAILLLAGPAEWADRP